MNFLSLKKPNEPTSMNYSKTITFVTLFSTAFYIHYFLSTTHVLHLEELWDKVCDGALFFLFLGEKYTGLPKSVRTLKKLKRHSVESPAVTFLQKIEKEETCKFSISDLFLVVGFLRNNFFTNGIELCFRYKEKWKMRYFWFKHFLLRSFLAKKEFKTSLYDFFFFFLSFFFLIFSE